MVAVKEKKRHYINKQVLFIWASFFFLLCVPACSFILASPSFAPGLVTHTDCSQQSKTRREGSGEKENDHRTRQRVRNDGRERKERGRERQRCSDVVIVRDVSVCGAAGIPCRVLLTTCHSHFNSNEQPHTHTHREKRGGSVSHEPFLCFSLSHSLPFHPASATAAAAACCCWCSNIHAVRFRRLTRIALPAHSPFYTQQSSCSSAFPPSLHPNEWH